MFKNFTIAFVLLSASLMLSSAMPFGFNNFRSYRGGYGFGNIGGTYSNFPGFGGAYSAFPAHGGIAHSYNSVNYHRHVTPYSYRGRGFRNNILSGSTLPSLALGFLVGKAL
ncbi:uncharacterized protein LOC134694669 [Mytilus trossulus]|uniref:uncharacterized protein LOC134694669 n=1 Tax=Mytilus trossulus TaxID=6551 RepID=UPI003003E7C0